MLTINNQRAPVSGERTIYFSSRVVTALSALFELLFTRGGCQTVVPYFRFAGEQFARGGQLFHFGSRICAVSISNFTEHQERPRTPFPSFESRSQTLVAARSTQSTTLLSH